MRKITVKEDPAFALRTGAVPPTRLTATLNEGKRIERLVDSMPGFPGQPMTRAEVERKFRSNVGRRWPQQQTDEILQALWTLEATNDLSDLLGKLAIRT
jgi:2-methylcitrate dehydratase